MSHHHHQPPQHHHHHQPPQHHHHHQPPQHHLHHPQQHHHHHSPVGPPRYGTFQGVPVIGFLRPTGHPSRYNAHGYHAVPGSEEAGKTPERQSPLPCCGCGVGWCLFILGFLLAGIPWYIAACILLCGKIDPREKPGYIACAVGAVLVTIAVIVVVVLVVV